ncbi:DUF6493 family protein [Nonomuraea sp. NPDC046802]|uniref:DUF7824 domain-containing protein n=1 Tax=Nonomuraea sp. NPDC046802 TaxID=3154919 RepID=UPI0033D7F300
MTPPVMSMGVLTEAIGAQARGGAAGRQEPPGTSGEAAPGAGGGRGTTGRALAAGRRETPAASDGGAPGGGGEVLPDGAGGGVSHARGGVVPEAGGPGAAWEAVVAAIDSGDVELVAERVLALDGQARRQVAAALPAHIPVAEKRAQARRREREARRERDNEAAWQEYRRSAARRGRTVYDFERWQWDAPWNRPARSAMDENWIGPMRVAGAAAIGGAAAVVAWLNRREFDNRWNEASDNPALLERILSTRPPSWQADFATRAALRLRDTVRGRRRLDDAAAPALAMLRRTGITPPEHDPLVLAWLSRQVTAADLRDDPLLDHLLPRVFEAEGAGRVLRNERAEPPGTGAWLSALAELEREGRIGRDLLLDGCLRRFLRGGQAADLRFFVQLHELIAPTREEVGERARDYLRLLSTAPGPVAEPALRHLRGLGSLGPAEVTQALRALLFRQERKLVTAGLTWFDAVAREPGGDLDELAPALAYAFVCESADVQGRAVRMAVKHAKRFTAAGARSVRESIGLLPPELGEALAAVFGEEAAGLDGFTTVPLPEPKRAGPFPAPVRTVEELGDWPFGGGWEATELWLAGVVRLHAADRAGLAAKLAAGRPPGNPPKTPLNVPWNWCREITRVILAQADGTAPEAGARLPEPGDVLAPHLFTLRRCAEIHDALAAGTLPPYLLAEPTRKTGHVDAAELVERLAGYERAGVEAMPADLQQALLRLPRENAPEVVARAATLTSEAGRTAARWMNGGRPEPVTEVIWSNAGSLGPVTEAVRPEGGRPDRVDVRLDGVRKAPLDDRAPVGPGGLRPMPRIRAAATGLPLVDGLFTDPDPSGWDGADGFIPWWPYVLPSDREVVAQHLLPHLLDRWDRPAFQPSHAHALAPASGPAGEAMALVQAHVIAGPSEPGPSDERSGLVVDLAARGELNAEEVGRQLGLLVRRASAKPGLVFRTLENAAVQGAQREVWRIMTGFLPVFLPGEAERPHARHTQGLAFALRAARWAEARGPLPCVAEVAGRRASNNLVREARRLHSFLA